jgi:hypothetical protein
MMQYALAIALSGSAPAVTSDQPSKMPEQSDCELGPVTKTYGGTPWLAYACNDAHSLLLVSAPGSSAMPFVFVFHWEEEAYHLAGAGSGNKAATGAAFRDLGGLTEPEIKSLLGEAQAAACR